MLSSHVVSLSIIVVQYSFGIYSSSHIINSLVYFDREKSPVMDGFKAIMKTKDSSNKHFRVIRCTNGVKYDNSLFNRRSVDYRKISSTYNRSNNRADGKSWRRHSSTCSPCESMDAGYPHIKYITSIPQVDS